MSDWVWGDAQEKTGEQEFKFTPHVENLYQQVNNGMLASCI